MLTVEVIDEATITAADDNGWDIDWEDSECIAGETWEFNAYSKDLNGGGRDQWLGIPTKNNVLLKCFCSEPLSEEPDFSDEVDISDWATERGTEVDLRFMSSAERILYLSAMATVLTAIVIF